MKITSTRKDIFINLLLTFCGAFIFSLSHPGFIFPNGISLFAWIMYTPAFLLVHRTKSIKSAAIWGGFYGALSYFFYVSWVVTFSTVAAIAVFIEYFISYAILFLFMKLSEKVCTRNTWICQYLILCSHEYLKTLGFAGFSYGVAGYTQWQNIFLIQSSSLFGVWGITFLIDFCSAIIYAIIVSAKDYKIASLLHATKKHILHIAIFGTCLLSFIFYGYFLIARRKAPSDFIKVCAVQHNTDPWKGGIEEYEKDVKNLMRLTENALEKDSDIELIVWPETSVIPSIMTHYKLRKDRRRFDLINSVLQFINEKSASFVIGNFHSVDTGTSITDDYNSAFLFIPKTNVIPPNPTIYQKMHLVPFTETVPFAKQIPWLYDLLEKADTHLWEKGSERTVFNIQSLSFSVPICFEDTFGNDCRKFVNNGARAFVNMSNDAWSKSLSCQKQHLSMAVFRCAENRVVAVRSTASGQTCVIDITGEVLVEAEPFTQTYITYNMPLPDDSAGKTLYNKIGDLLAIIVVILAIAFIIIEFINSMKTKSKL